MTIQRVPLELVEGLIDEEGRIPLELLPENIPIGGEPVDIEDKPIQYHRHSFTTDGISATYTAPFTLEGVGLLVFAGSTYQPESTYTVEGSDITFVEVPDEGIEIELVIGDSSKGAGSCDSYTKEQMVDIAPWISTAVGGIQTLMFDTPAIFPPTDSALFRYILLTEGLDGAGQYNEGILINETIMGSGVERQVTAEINLPDSPLHGQVIHLINSERSHLRPGETAGVFEQDQMQRITGSVGVRGGNTGGAPRGVFSSSSTSGDRPNGTLSGGSFNPMRFDSANSIDARTGDHTNVKHIQATYYMRIA